MNYKTAIIIVLGFVIISGIPQEGFAQKRIEYHKPHHTYRQLPKRGQKIVRLGGPAVAVKFRGINYHIVRGIFYKPLGGQFVVVAPPVGIRVNALPPEHIVVNLRSESYFYNYGTFYCRVGTSSQYEVVPPPIGAMIPALPEGYNTTIIDGRKYYELDGVYYQEVITENQELWYEVVGANSGSTG